MTTLAKLCQRYVSDKHYWMPAVYAVSSIELINFVRVEILKNALRNKVFVLELTKKGNHTQLDDLVKAMVDDGISPVIVGETDEDFEIAMLATDNLAILEPTSEKELTMLKQLGLDDLATKTIEVTNYKVRVFKGYTGDLKSMKQTLFAQYSWHEVHKK